MLPGGAFAFLAGTGSVISSSASSGSCSEVGEGKSVGTAMSVGDVCGPAGEVGLPGAFAGGTAGGAMVGIFGNGAGGFAGGALMGVFCGGALMGKFSVTLGSGICTTPAGAFCMGIGFA
jgi:hypothetical protein